MPTIALLSDALIDQIAAGEVVERPASVVKELGENAVDAGARTVHVRIEEGGARLVELVDDGAGMSPEDAVLSVQRHATSKLRTAEDLVAIRTLGFRGEALAAIGSVSRLILRTARAGDAEGTEVVVEAGAPPRVGPAAARAGTQVRVEELFATVPARRKFLRRAETEARHVEEAVLRLALANPSVAFRLDADGRSVLSLPPAPGRVADRIAAALGPEVAPHLLAFEERRLGIRVHGVIASPEYTLSTARSLYAFVNGRHVRDRTLHFAVHRGLAPLLPSGRQPVGVLFVELDPARVDVNVHPQKLEVRFADAADVTEAVQAAVARAVRGAAARTAPGGSTASTPEYAFAVERFLARAQDGAAPLTLAPGAERAPAFGEALPDRNAAPAPGFFAGLRPLGTLRGRVAVCEGPGGSLVALDVHAMRERILADRLRRTTAQEAPLLGSALALSATVAARVSRRREALAAVGLVLEPFGPEAFRLVAVPAPLVAHRPEPLVEAALHALESGQAPPQQRAALACAAAADADADGGRAPGDEALRALLRELEGADFAVPVRHARLVALETPLLSLLG